MPPRMPLLSGAPALRLGVATALAASLIAASTAPATAAPTWLPTTALGPASASGDGVSIGLDTNGNAVAVWSQANGGSLQVVAASRPAGGSWTAPSPLSGAGVTAVHPEVVLADDGQATAVWFRATGPTSYALESSTRSAAGAWAAAADLPGTSDDTARAALAVRPSGAVVVAWPRNVSGGWYESVAEHPTGGAWGAPADVEGPAAASPGSAAIGVDGAGLATVLWPSGAATGGLLVSTSPAGGPWSAAAAVSAPGQPTRDPAIAVAGDGTTMATWSRYDGSAWVVQTATRASLAGGWTGTRDLSPAGWSATHSVIGTNALGTRYVAAWTAAPTSGPTAVQSSVYGPHGWEPALGMSDPSVDADSPQIAVTRSNAASLVWRQGPSGAHVVRAALMGATSGGFAAPTTLSPAGRDASAPRQSTDQVGDAVAVWGDASAGDFSARYAVYDAGGPVLPGFHVSGQVAVGAKASYSATATDPWSTVTSYSWSIDGTTVSGPTATHVFDAKGSYAVVLTVTDSAGNITKRVARTKVIAPPEITAFKVTPRTITTKGSAKLKVGLSQPADVRIVLRSKHRQDTGGKLKHRIKIVIKRSMPAGTTVAAIKGKKLVPDSWVITGTARRVGVDSAPKTQVLVVTKP